MLRTIYNKDKSMDTTPASVQTTETIQSSRLSRVKLGFLYVVIGGLVVSALISVVAILIGEFNSVIQKALFTTFLLVLHGCIALLIVLADTRNQLGKSLIATTILGVVIANMLTSALGIWDILPGDMSSRLVGVYTLLVGTAFIIAGMLRLRLPHQPTTALAYASCSLMAVLALGLIPWILFHDSPFLSDLYYRAVGAVGILTVTGLLITCIVNRITVAQRPELVAAQPRPQGYQGGMLAVVIISGVLAALFWLYGIGSFIYSATYYRTAPYVQPQSDPYEVDDTYNDYDDSYYNEN